MKKLLYGLLALVVLVIAALLIAPFLIPVDTYKTQIARAVEDATGRKLAINGDFSLSLLPNVALEANDVTFANPPGYPEPQMATLQQLVVELQVWPLLSGDVKVDSFVLVKPVIHLAVNEQGQPNWQFATKPQKPEPAESEEGDGGGPAITQLSLGDVRLADGLVTYRDAKTGAHYELSDINMSVSLPDLDSPFAADGSLVWNDEKIGVKVESDQLRPFLTGEPAMLSASVDSQPINLGYQGSVTTGKQLQAEGDVDLNVPSIRELAAWTGNPIQAGGTGLGLLEITGKVTVLGKAYSFTDAKIALDNMNATGNLTAETGGQKPYVKANLDVDQLDLNPYLPPPAEGKPGDAEEDGQQQGEKAPSGWSEEPIDLKGLNAANADLELAVGGIRLREIRVGRSALGVSLKDGLLVADLKELNLYQGKGKGSLSLNGRGEVPAVEASFAIEGVQAQPLLTDAAGFDNLEGTGQFDLKVATKGGSQLAMVRALDGSGAVLFTDGTISGLNLAAMVRNVTSAFADAEAGKPQKTDFGELSGTFRIDDGILKNDDMRLLNPLIRVKGSGTVNLPQRTIDYRMVPTVVASLEGQGAEGAATGLAVPVIIKGPWTNLSYKPDLENVIKDIASDPTKALKGAEETIKKLEKGGDLGKVLEGVTGGSSKKGGKEEGSPLRDAEKALKGLFGN